MLELRQTEVSKDPADDRSTSPDVTALSSQVPASGVQHLRGEVDHRNLGNVVGSAADTSAQGTQTDGRGLGDDGVRDGSEGEGVAEGDQDSQDGLGVIGGVVLGDGGTDTEDDEEGDVGRGTVEVDGSAAEPGG